MFMAHLILDAEGWQNVVDFKTGESLQSWDNPVVDDMLPILSALPYPGDANLDSIEWTGEMGKALYDYYKPDFIMLAYATADFVKSSVPQSAKEEAETHRRLFASAEDFLTHTGCTPLIIGTGGMSEIRGELIEPHMRNRFSQTNGLNPYAGLFRAARGEIEGLANIPHTRLFTKADVRRDFPEADEDYIATLPDAILLRESGYAFSRSGYRGMRMLKSPDVEDTLPIHTTLPLPRHITDTRRVIDEAIDEGKRVALIILEACGAKDFLIPHASLPASDKWMIYAGGMSQYSAILSGEPFYRSSVSLIHDSLTRQHRSPLYPYSQFSDGHLPENALGRREGVRTAAVGSRSIFTHSMTQADICVECQARQMVASGLLALINVPK
jgi:hypothetical protein